MSLPSVYPYCEVTFDRTRTYPSGRTFRVIAYGRAEGRDTPGGAAVFDEDRKMVLVDGLFALMPQEAMLSMLEVLLEGDLSVLVASVNGHPMRRFTLDEEGGILLNDESFPGGLGSEYLVQ